MTTAELFGSKTKKKTTAQLFGGEPVGHEKTIEPAQKSLTRTQVDPKLRRNLLMRGVSEDKIRELSAPTLTGINLQSFKTGANFLGNLAKIGIKKLGDEYKEFFTDQSMSGTTSEEEKKQLIKDFSSDISDKVGGGLSFVKSVLQETFRSGAGVGLELTGEDELKTGPVLSKIVGEEKIISTEKQGQQLLKLVGASDDDIKKLGLWAGLSSAVLDFLPEGKGTKKIISRISKSTDKEDILVSLKTLFNDVPDDELLSLAGRLKYINTESDVVRVLKEKSARDLINAGEVVADRKRKIPTTKISEELNKIPKADKIVKELTVPSIPVKTTIRKVTGQTVNKELKALNAVLKKTSQDIKKTAGTIRLNAIKEYKEALDQREFLKQIKNDIKGVFDEARVEKEALLRGVSNDIARGFEKEKSKIRKEIGFERFTKQLPTSINARIKQVIGISEMKNATIPQLETARSIYKTLEPGDAFLTNKQVDGLAFYLKEYKEPMLVTQREVKESLADRKDIFKGIVSSKISPNLFPTVDIKEESNLIKRVVDRADELTRAGQQKTKLLSVELDTLLTSAERTSKFSGKVVGERIFQAMGGKDVPLSKEEEAVTTFLKNFFEQAKKDLNLKNYRKNYITHTEKDFYEKLSSNNFNLVKTIQSFTDKKSDTIPVDILNNLDNIIGSKKFFRFALERKGGIDPSTNIRRILRDYSTILEDKKALEKVLPEGQAVQQLLLKEKGSVWLADYLKNLKGRGLDYKIRRNNPNLMRAADKIVDFGYLRLLALNTISGIKNIIGGEVNSIIFQPFTKYLTGKKRFLTEPFKAHRTISDLGLLDGSYVDIVSSRGKDKLKTFVNNTLYAPMSVAEYEIRGSYLLGEMTDAEWKTGRLTNKRYREIMDGIARTQGVYNKIDSPLFAQTTIGRSILQFARWKITNAALIRKIGRQARAEWKTKNFTGDGTRKLLKMITIYGGMSYLAAEFAKSGNEQMKKIAESGTETFNVLLDMPQSVLDAITKNPALQTMDSAVFTLDQGLSYLGLKDAPSKLQFRSGLEDTYFSSLKSLGISDGTLTPKKESTTSGNSRTRRSRKRNRSRR